MIREVFVAVFLFSVLVADGFTPSKFSGGAMSKIMIRSSTETEMPLRIGHGFDIHRLVENRKLIIGKISLHS